MASVRECLFCPSHELNREHLWPDWLVKMLPKGDGLYTARAEYDDGRPPTERQADTIPHKARFVCEACNGGWMSGIEGSTKDHLVPLIFRALEPRTLSAEQQRLLAVWAVLRTMVYDSQSIPENRYHSRDQRWAFAGQEARREPPPFTHVWIGLFATKQFRAVISATRQVVPSGDKAAQVLTMAIGQLVIQVGAHRGLGRPADDEDPNDLLDPDWRNFMIEIWPPPRDGLKWPPSAHLDDDGVQELRGRFGDGKN